MYDWLMNTVAGVVINAHTTCTPLHHEIQVLCEMGGSLDNKPGVTTGFQSRSLKAIYKLREAGFARLYHVRGGLMYVCVTRGGMCDKRGT